MLILHTGNAGSMSGTPYSPLSSPTGIHEQRSRSPEHCWMWQKEREEEQRRRESRKSGRRRMRVRGNIRKRRRGAEGAAEALEGPRKPARYLLPVPLCPHSSEGAYVSLSPAETPDSKSLMQFPARQYITPPESVLWGHISI